MIIIIIIIILYTNRLVRSKYWLVLIFVLEKLLQVKSVIILWLKSDKSNLDCYSLLNRKKLFYDYDL